jgi:hypothetical protein
VQPRWKNGPTEFAVVTQIPSPSTDLKTCNNSRKMQVFCGFAADETAPKSVTKIRVIFPLLPSLGAWLKPENVHGKLSHPDARSRRKATGTKCAQEGWLGADSCHRET